MRIGIDMSFVSGNKVGVDQYVYNVLKNLAGIDRENSYFLYSHRDIPGEFKVFGENFVVRAKGNRLIHRILWLTLVLPRLLKNDKIDLLHAPCYVAPGRLHCPLVVTFYDMASWLFPDKFRLRHRIYYSLFVGKSIGKADRIIAISNATKKDMTGLFEVPENKIEVIPGAAGDSFSPVKDKALLEGIRRKYGVPARYILFVGILEPRKNITSIIKAFKKLKVAGKFEHKLVIAGRKGWKYDEIFDIVRELKLEDEVVFTGYVDDRNLPALYSGAELFVYPSIYEGFGLPLLEAMSCGVPVITSNVSSLPEVAGEAALLIGPEDVAGLAEAMAKIINDTVLRERMIRKGLERARGFSWKKAAEQTLEVYGKMVG